MSGRALVFDLGASSGRAMLCGCEKGTLTLAEIHRFPNDPVMLRGTFYWDILRLLHEIKLGMVKANAAGGFASVGIDTWGVDFGIIGGNGKLSENPVNYRDKRTNGILPKAYEKISPKELYAVTGIQIMEINTAFQLFSLTLDRKDMLESGNKILFIPDLLGFMLTGRIFAEQSIASTSGLLDAQTGNWSDRVISALGLPRGIFPDIIPSGSKIGVLDEETANELCIPQCDVTAVCGHDTQCACAAVPAEEEDFIFISCGTWSLFGTELDRPVLTEASADFNITNEKGYGGKTSFLKNIIGLWFIQETRRFLKNKGREYSFAELESAARDSEPFKCFIDTEAPEFVPPGDIPQRVREYCRKTGQYVPGGIGEVMRCIYESLALKYRMSLEEISRCTGKEYGKIYMIGGGIKDTLLCRMTACACNCTVSAGPVEATAYGNGIIQLISKGEIPDIKTARKMLAASEDIKLYRPENISEWDCAYEKYRKIIGK
ncbi:MAG: rhamnulokinase [Ruminococcus sp.]|nr:rhamnulokinase [Ruminococcus sp.]